MAFIHKKWDKSGRTLVDDQDSTKFRYQSFVGQKNIDIGGGELAPYVWDSTNSIAKYGNYQVQFFDWYQVVKKLPEDEVVIDDQRFEVQYFQGNQWRTLDLYNRATEVTEDTENGILFIKKIYTGDGLDRLEVEYQIGQRDFVTFSTRLRVETARTYHIRWQNSGIAGEVSEQSHGIKFDKILFRWMESENLLRSYTTEQQAQGKKVDIFIGPFDLAAGEEVYNHPDTWGYTDADSDADLNITDTVWDPNTGSSLLFAGCPADTDEWNLGLRFVDVTVPKDSTINNAYIRLARDAMGVPVVWKVRGIDEDNTGVFASDDNWTDRDQTTAAIDWDEAVAWSWGVLTASPDIADIIAEITSRASWVSGNAMGIWLDDDGCSGWKGIKAFDETTASYEPDMQIDYTEGVGEEYQRAVAGALPAMSGAVARTLEAKRAIGGAI